MIVVAEKPGREFQVIKLGARLSSRQIKVDRLAGPSESQDAMEAVGAYLDVGTCPYILGSGQLPDEFNKLARTMGELKEHCSLVLLPSKAWRELDLSTLTGCGEVFKLED